ncbi:MAG: LysR family transcriptional regulator [Gammaproteobacteria bacterium]|nr:LysR family transcriptional regulator [Gammaproteobacteria bacterium]MBI5614917.1 LysR family transcriptional regulator [Gammaproteobacteria bacterium]
MDRLRSIEMFVRTVECGNLSRAAAELGLSPAVASRGLADLESRLATRLMHRSSRRLALTESGQIYYTRCKQILEDLQEAEALATENTVKPRGTLRLNVPVSFGIHQLGPLWAEFLARYPELELAVSLNDRLVDLLDQGYDLGIRIARIADSTLIAKQLARTRMICCAAPAYLARRGEPRAPEELRDHTCLGYTHLNTRDEWVFHGRQDRAEHRVGIHCVMHADNGDTIRHAALAGAGLVLQPSFIVGEDLKAGTLVEILPEYRSMSLGIYAIYPTRKHVPVRVRLFVDYLLKAFGDDPEADPWDA